MALLRDKNTSTKEFKELVNEITMLLTYEATRDLPLTAVKVETPMAVADCEKLAEDLMAKGQNIKELLDKIAERAPMVVVDYTARLKERISELLDGNAVLQEERILTEAAIFADKCSIDEEITRLDSHLIQMKKIIDSPKDAEGKKLDFLVQEMNREANTIGSKANDISITGYMLEIKSEIEKIREQVQNIE